MHLLCHRDHPLAAHGDVALADLDGEAFVDGPVGSASRATNDAAFAATGAVRTVAYEINDAHGMVDLVAAGLAVAILPPAVAEDAPDVRCVALRPPVPMLEIALALPANRPLGAAADDLAARILVEARPATSARAGARRA
jgi:DNA-binding transcriptional LysR family regulator